MSTCVTGVFDLANKECHKTMLRNDMNLSRLMVYSQYIEESKHSRISWNLKRSGFNEKNQSRFKKTAPNNNGTSSPKVKGEGGSNFEVLSLLVLLVGRSTLG